MNLLKTENTPHCLLEMSKITLVPRVKFFKHKSKIINLLLQSIVICIYIHNTKTYNKMATAIILKLIYMVISFIRNEGNAYQLLFILPPQGPSLTKVHELLSPSPTQPC